MRCEEVIRELATPTDMADPATLSDHLDQCPSCAAWAKRAARLDRLWQETQPAEPTSGAWENVWAQVVSSLHDQPVNDAVALTRSVPQNGSLKGSPPRTRAWPIERPVISPLRSRRRTAFAMVGLAQAAAILLVVTLSWRAFMPSRLPQKAAVAVLTSVDIEEGQMVMIVADPKLPAVVDLTPKTMTAGVDRVDWYGDEKYFDWFMVYHEVESLAKPTVAMKE